MSILDLNLDDLFKSMAKGEYSSLALTYNEDFSPSYEKAIDYYFPEEWEQEGFISKAECEKALLENSVWTLHWYPRTPVVFHRIRASSILALFQALAGTNFDPKEQERGY
jgi:hypothetical protein